VDFAAKGGQWLEAFEQSRRYSIEIGTRYGPLSAEAAWRSHKKVHIP
jgi:hypothetical protein